MGEWIAVRSYNGPLLRNKKTQTIDACDNMGESQNNYAKWMKPLKIEAYCMTPLPTKNLDNTNYSDRKQISGCLGLGEWQITKRFEETFEVMAMFIIWISWWFHRCTVGMSKLLLYTLCVFYCMSVTPQ